MELLVVDLLTNSVDTDVAIFPCPLAAAQSALSLLSFSILSKLICCFLSFFPLSFAWTHRLLVQGTILLVAACQAKGHNVTTFCALLVWLSRGKATADS